MVNEILFDTLNLLKAATYEMLNDKAKIIVDSFLNKSDYLDEMIRQKEVQRVIEKEPIEFFENDD